MIMGHKNQSNEENVVCHDNLMIYVEIDRQTDGLPRDVRKLDRCRKLDR